jgi:phage gp36-like protein
MPYSTVRDVRLALTPDTPEEGDGPAYAADTAASLSDAHLADAIREADGRIDYYLGTRYAVPVEFNGEIAPEPLRSWSRNIAAYLANLVFRRHKDLPADDPVRLRYTDTMSALVAVQESKTDLPFDPIPPGTENAGGSPVGGVGGLFTPEDWRPGPHSFHPTQPGWWNW